jgi:hypothetical protein
MTKKTANKTNISFLGNLTLEKWHKLAPGTQYKYILLARQASNAGGRNFLQDIGVPLESSLKTLRKAHEDYLRKTNLSEAAGTDSPPIRINEHSENQSPDFEHTTQESIAQTSQPSQPSQSSQSTSYVVNKQATTQRRIDIVHPTAVNQGESGKDSQ